LDGIVSLKKRASNLPHYGRITAMSLPRIPSQKIDAFNQLRAEFEIDWLDQVFVQPPDFDQLTHNRSAIIFADSGDGKTAARLALGKFCEMPAQLIVNWIPSFPNKNDDQILGELFSQVLDHIAKALLNYLGRNPKFYWDCSSWVKDYLRSYIKCHLLLPYHFITDQILEVCTSDDITQLFADIESPSNDIISKETDELIVIENLIAVIKKLNLSGIWLLVDSLETLLLPQEKNLKQTINALLSCLSLFDRKGLVFKVFLPKELKAVIDVLSPHIINRVENINLEWNQKYLIEIVRKRIAFVTNYENLQLDDVCEAAIFKSWLSKYGGLSPRRWLELAQPVFTAYLSQEKFTALTNEVLFQVIHKHIPKLHLDLVNQKVYIGGREITGLDPGSYKVLHYLYINRGKVCTREEIYYLGYQQFPEIPKKREGSYESLTMWRGLLDTVLWRLRNVLETNLEYKIDENPTYVVTVRNQGIRLENTSWD
jgi:hypothetical protein